MAELLKPGAAVYATPVVAGAARKTRYDLTLVEYGGELVSVDSRLPPRLVAEAIQRRSATEFGSYDKMATEVRLGDSRVDLVLSNRRHCLYIETKSVNKAADGTALFPDAVTTRGAKHLRSLLAAVKSGHRAAVVFVIQRGDAERLIPDEESDPRFCETLRRAVDGGVEALAYRCSVSRSEIAIHGRVPVVL